MLLSWLCKLTLHVRLCRVRVQSSNGLFRSPLVHAQALVNAAVAAPDEPTDRLAFLSAPEVDTLLRGFNAAVLAPTDLLHPEQTLHGVLEHWAAIQPDAPALVYEARTWPLMCQARRGGSCGP